MDKAVKTRMLMENFNKYMKTDTVKKFKKKQINELLRPTDDTFKVNSIKEFHDLLFSIRTNFADIMYKRYFDNTTQNLMHDIYEYLKNIGWYIEKWNQNGINKDEMFKFNRVGIELSKKCNELKKQLDIYKQDTKNYPTYINSEKIHIDKIMRWVFDLHHVAMPTLYRIYNTNNTK